MLIMYVLTFMMHLQIIQKRLYFYLLMTAKTQMEEHKTTTSSITLSLCVIQWEVFRTVFIQ